MRSGLVNILVRQLHRSASESGPCRTDADLVRRFATERDPEAFTELVQRHGPLVWGVCRRSVANRSDAEDAFQATFLVFAKSARSIRKPDALGAWLHGVAYRVALRMRIRGESLQTEPLSSAPSCLESLTLREFLAALDDELTALPDKYRGPLVLCFLQERTQDDAAKRLGVSLSTLKRRLETGRELLRGRLTRRGVELPAVLLAAGLGGGVVPTALAEGVVQAATVGAAGVVSANVLTITEGVIHAMWETKLRTWVVGILIATAAASGTGYFAYTGQAQPGADRKPANTPAEKKPDPNDRLRAAELEAAKAEILIAEASLNRTMKDYDRMRQLAQSGAVAATELAQAESKVDEAKAQLLRAKAQYEIHIARMDAEKEKARYDADLRRTADERSRLDRYEEAFAAQTAAPEIQKLRAERVKVAQAVMDDMWQSRIQGAVVGQNFQSFVEAYCIRSKRLLEAEHEFSANAQDRLKAAQAHLNRMKDFEKFANERAGLLGRKSEADAVTVCRLEAEILVKTLEAGRVGDPRKELSRLDRDTGELQKAKLEKEDRLTTDRAQLKAEDLAKRLTQLEREVVASRVEAEKARVEALTERKRAEDLMKRVEDLTRKLVKETTNPDKVPSAPEGYRGTIAQIDGDLFTVSPGADAGLTKGAVLEVYRTEATLAKYLGKVTILSVNPKEAVGRFTSIKAKPPANELPKIGDELRPAK